MKILKVIGWVLAALVVMSTLVYLYASWQVDQRLAKQYNVAAEEFPIPTDSASIAKGSHLVDIKGCRDCHGDNLGGKIFADELLIGKLAGPNLTRGKGGIPDDYATLNWIKAIRHGLDSSNHPLMVMPSLETSKMSQEDLGAMIAYLNDLPPVDNSVPESKLGVMIKTMIYIGELDVIPAEQIDHTATLVKSMDTSSPVKYGKYLATMCSGCHHENMKGGPPMVPGSPSVPDLTATGATGRWTQEQFNTALRTGKRPDGTELDPNMPVQMTKHYSDEELQALYTYLKSL
ncbi:c-type cytochrome [Fulvivirgaceae bacterium PWU4]|uniref:C-type cytochrome n=1 Tax=Chryseosolibacter histidini TaxID=2782349 RepID=A0AAP2DIE6_9BACT|nr:c-type cytochrome [Chryseosolibacter histidini]MBT1695953.1 c-type cytochrome [Chryseosolibacter histidini]